MHVVILGAGFGGLELSTRLSEELGDEIKVTLIDSNDHFIFGFSKLDVMFGRNSAESVRCYYRDIVKPGVEFRQEIVTSINPKNKSIITNQGEYDADVLVVALGAAMDVDATPGLKKAGHEFYTPEGAEELNEIVTNFDTGTVVIGVMGSIFKCPPAPCEAAFMLHDEFKRRGVQDNTKIILVSSMSSPVPLSKEMSDTILSTFADRNIEFVGSAEIKTVDPKDKLLKLADGRDIPFDLLMAVPIHRAPIVVENSEISTDGWINVDPRTLKTSFDDVYAIGDVTNTRVPRAGVFAEGQAKVVASSIISNYRDLTVSDKYAGDGTCYIEFGEGDLAKIEVNFLGGHRATGRFTAPSSTVGPQKKLFGSSRKQRWFNNS